MAKNNYNGQNSNRRNGNTSSGVYMEDGKMSFNTENFTNLLTPFTRKNITTIYSKDNNNKKQSFDNRRQNGNDLEDERESVLNTFINNIREARTSHDEIKEIITDQFVNVCGICRSYFEIKDENIINLMNKVFKIIATSVFSKSLFLIITNDDERNQLVTNATQQRSIGITLSIALNIVVDQMTDDTISKHVEIIISYLYANEYAEVTNNQEIYENLVTDLFIRIPSFNEKFTELEAVRTCHLFLDTVMIYADEVIDYLDATEMKKLFYYIFPDIDDQTSKIIGKCLIQEYPRFIGSEEEQDMKNSLLNEYVEMLYTILNDDNDINIITRTIKFIAKKLRERDRLHKEGNVLFNANEAAVYKNIRKVIVSVASSTDDKEIRRILIE